MRIEVFSIICGYVTMSELEGLCQCMGQCCLAIGQVIAHVPCLGHCHGFNQDACLLLTYLMVLSVGIGGTAMCYAGECGYELYWLVGTIVWFLYGFGLYVYWEIVYPWYQSKKAARASNAGSEAFSPLLPDQDSMSNSMQEP